MSVAMSVDGLLDDKSKMILELLRKQTKGLGQNKMELILTGKIARNTLKKRLDYLEYERKLIKNLNADLSHGKSYQYVHTETYDNYKKLIDTIVFETKEYISVIERLDKMCDLVKSKKHEDSDKLIDKIFDLQNYTVLKIRQFYSMPMIIDATRSWGNALIKNKDTVVEILKLLYDSYDKVDKAIVKFRNNQYDLLTLFEEKIDKVFEEMEEKHPDIFNRHDEKDLKYLNMYKDNKISRDIAYTKIFGKKENTKIK